MSSSDLEIAAQSTESVGLRHAFVGDLSEFSRQLRTKQSFRQLSSALRRLLGSDAGSIGILQDGVDRKRVASGSVRRTAEALAELIDAAAEILAASREAILGDKNAVQSVRFKIRKAVEVMSGLVHGSETVTLTHWATPRDAKFSVHWIDQIFSEISGCRVAVLLAYQHLRLLLDIDDTASIADDELPDESRLAVPRFEAATPVLGAESGGGGGMRMMLTVTLFPSELEGFVPDLRYFGLTELTHDDPKYCLWNSTRKCWDAAGIKGYRGVWRMEHVNTSSDGDLHIPPHIYGPSFEAAFVCCLRAAVGNAYAEEEFDGELGSEDLSPTVAITASLGEFETGKTDLIDIPLIPVAGVPQKLCEARGSTITQVVFAEDQWTEKAIAGLDDESREDREKAKVTTQKPEDQSKLLWSTVANVGAALDVLLERNRWLRAWQTVTRDNWLERWEKGTARAPGDEAPGPDEKNLPTGEQTAVAETAAEAE